MSIRALLWGGVVRVYPIILSTIYKMTVGRGCVISWKAHLDKSINPKGIKLGDNVWILNGAMLLAHDNCRGIKADCTIGDNTIIGVRSVVMPGVTVGNNCVVGACSVVTKDIPSGCMVVGNPAKIIRQGIIVEHGKIVCNGECI